ncbi:hypothetical protein HPB48_017740 [Haemaphysalis longicornis]|uniref:Ig-like domain-containing protein n=1 Tax=Haemaphysalis longicornis TaxID=44386 RepID=A0A9J6G270_HAELO|nr:hypothetical protein HPB48_017740 [Haemaphysalis longicornis]
MLDGAPYARRTCGVRRTTGYYYVFTVAKLVICTGVPEPTVSWWRNGTEQLHHTTDSSSHGVTRSTLELPQLHRHDLNASLVCKASNHNGTYLVASGVSLELYRESPPVGARTRPSWENTDSRCGKTGDCRGCGSLACIQEVPHDLASSVALITKHQKNAVSKGQRFRCSDVATPLVWELTTCNSLGGKLL